MSKIIFCAIVLALFVSSSFELSAQELAISDENLLANASYEPLEAIANITLGKQPYSIAVNDETNRVYVGVEGGLMVINGETDQIIAEIPLGDDVKALAVNPQTNRIYAGVSGENVTVIDGATNLPIGAIPEGIYDQCELAVNPVTNRVYVAYEAVFMGHYDSVLVYDGENLQFVISVKLGLSSYFQDVGVAVNPKTNIVYATWTGNSSLYMIDGNTHAITGNVRPSSFSDTVMVNSYTNYVYVGQTVLNGETLEYVTSDYTGTIEAIDPIHNLLYTIEYDNLYRLDGSTHGVIDSLTLHRYFDYYDRIAVNPKTSRIYITDYQGKQVCVVSAGALPQPSATPYPTSTPTPTLTPTPSPSPTATPTVNVVFEEAHDPGEESVSDEYSEFADYLVGHGYAVSTIDPPTTIDSGVLAPVDVLVIVAPENSYLTSELNAIENWVKGGGRLLLISEWGDWGLQASTIAARFGFTQRLDMILDSNENAAGNDKWPYYDGANLLPHPITAEVTRVEMYASDGITSAPADEIPLIVTDSDGTATWLTAGSSAYGVSVMSAIEGGTAGSGRLVIITDSGLWSKTDVDGDGEISLYDSDNEILALNTVNWLAPAGALPQPSATPYPTPTPTPTPTSTPSPSPTATPTPSPTSTSSPSPTASPTPTPTPSPSPSPTPSGQGLSLPMEVIYAAVAAIIIAIVAVIAVVLKKRQNRIRKAPLPPPPPPPPF